MKTRIAVLLAALVAVGSHAPARSADILTLAGRTELPGYTGDFDHFAYDVKSNRLWLAAEDHQTLDVFDLKSGKKLRSVEGIVDTPHAVHFVPGSNRLIVTDSGGEPKAPKLIDATSYKVTGALKLAAPGADEMRYDPGSKRLFIVNGGRDAKMTETYLSMVDPVTLKTYGDLKFDTDKVEAMVIEEKGDKLFINVTGKNYLAVVNKKTLKVLDTWPIKEAEQNAPLAFDEAGKRLFIVTRKPSKLVILDAESGATVASFDTPMKVNQVIWDAVTKRVFVLAGEGFISVFQQRGVDHYDELPRIATTVGAKTGILIPELRRLYVAVSPGEGKTGAAVLRYDLARATPDSTH